MSRINPYANLDLFEPLIDYARTVEARLEPTLLKLIEIRASQINGCAMCLSMHTQEARAAGETEQRIMMLSAWHESTLYSERERAALGWTDALTRVAETRAPDDAYAAVEKAFDEPERVNLTLMIGVINAFNMLGVGFRIRPPTRAKAAAAA